MQRVKKPTTHKGKKFLVNREAKLVENVKQTLFLQGRKRSETVTNCIKDLYHLKKPDAVKVKSKLEILPFESTVELEKFSRKYDTSLICFGSHSKKRPHNLLLGRIYDHQILDMVELGVKQYKSILDFENEKITTGLKPCILFCGPRFEQDAELKRLQNLLVDFFHRETADAVRLQGMEHVVMFTVDEKTLYMRSYRISLKKSGGRTPRIELEEIGPSIDFEIRRNRLASDDLFKQACKTPKELKEKKKKNMKRDVFGTQLGRLHVTPQNIQKLQTRKMKGLRKTMGEKRRIRETREKKNKKQE